MVNTTKTDCTATGRVCTKCKAFKEWRFYHVCRNSHFGYQSQCKKCTALDQKKYQKQKEMGYKKPVKGDTKHRPYVPEGFRCWMNGGDDIYI